MFKIITNQVRPNVFGDGTIPQGMHSGFRLISTEVAVRISQMNAVKVDIGNEALMKQ